jgi:hypothetical protein|tara:strand:- start:345 stop:524 length:180 start_codon:yes stop_codon:yes gene_type:complete
MFLRVYASLLRILACNISFNRQCFTFVDDRTNEQLSNSKPNHPSDMSNDFLGGNEQPKS